MNTRTIKVKSVFDETNRYLRKHYDIEVRTKIVHELLGNVSHARILDIGCGDGSLSLQYASDTNRITLVDLSENMLNIAEKNTPVVFKKNVEYINTHIYEYASDEQFDVILCVGLLAHVDSYENVLQKISQLLKPNGRCIIQVTDSDTTIGKVMNVYYSIRDRVRMSRRYRLQKTPLSMLISSARTYQIHMIDKRQYISPFPGMGLLPNEWLYRYECFSLNQPFLSRIGNETIGLYIKSA